MDFLKEKGVKENELLMEVMGPRGTRTLKGKQKGRETDNPTKGIGVLLATRLSLEGSESKPALEF